MLILSKQFFEHCHPVATIRLALREPPIADSLQLLMGANCLGIDSTTQPDYALRKNGGDGVGGIDTAAEVGGVDESRAAWVELHDEGVLGHA